MLTRRTLLRSTLALSGAAALNRVFGEAVPTVEIHLAAGTRAVSVPRNFAGLGYEMSSVALPGLLSSRNTTNVQLVRNLGRGGVLRLGGIVADFTSYSVTEAAQAKPQHTVITPANLQQLRGFLDELGWSAVWSVNFGRGTLEQALVETQAVRNALGNRLLAVELGNEVENYGNGTQPLRQPPYLFANYRAEYDRWHAAIVAENPGLAFAAPDTAASVQWVEQMAATAHDDVQLLTTHYYRGGQEQATLDQLLNPDPALPSKLDRLRRASTQFGMPWRMCETNSFFGGGRPGLSDTFANALWALDYMLLLAQSGCAGVNIETGFNQLGFLSSYSPIAQRRQGSLLSRSNVLRHARVCNRNGHTHRYLPAPVRWGSRPGNLLRPWSREHQQDEPDRMRSADQSDAAAATSRLAGDTGFSQGLLYASRSARPCKSSRYHAGWRECTSRRPVETTQGRINISRGTSTAVQRTHRPPTALTRMTHPALAARLQI